MKLAVKFMASLIALAVIITTVIVLLTVRQMALPPSAGGESVITVNPGQNLKQISKELEKQGVIRNSTYFRLLARYKGVGKNIRAGEYLIPKNLTPDQVLERLVSGKVIYRRFTVPEGKTLVEIAQIVYKTGICDANVFVSAASDITGMEKYLPPGAKDLEGTLFPETYTYTRQTTPKQLVSMMTGHFRRVFDKLWESKNPEYALKPFETVIMASIVEKETGRADERPIIAGVFFNRLRINMRLMSDPTVIYGIPNFNGNITRKNLETPSPYNTYLIGGLPAGPICSPGAESIKAALHPAQTQALYFVARGDGSHQFSNTLEEHNLAVNRYQRGGR